MKKADVKVGATYLAKVSNALVEVKVERVTSEGFEVVNLATKRRLTFASATKFREQVKQSKSVPGASVKFSDGKPTVLAVKGSKGFMKKVRAEIAKQPAPRPVSFRKNPNSRTCVVLPNLDAGTKYFRVVTMDPSGLHVKKFDPAVFDLEWKEIKSEDPTRPIRVYVEAARRYGATDEVVEEFSKLVTLTDEDREAIRTKSGAARIGTSYTGAKNMSGKNGGTGGGRGRTVASAFQELIRQGKLTDDQIFAKVQAEFGLDDKKRSYVSWYRNYLRKKGENVPDAKGGGKAAPAPKAAPAAKPAPAAKAKPTAAPAPKGNAAPKGKKF